MRKVNHAIITNIPLYDHTIIYPSVYYIYISYHYIIIGYKVIFQEVRVQKQQFRALDLGFPGPAFPSKTVCS